MNFAEAMRETTNWTVTENGMTARATAGDALLDMFSTIGALREADETRIRTKFDEAYAEDALIATKILFYARDIRGGLGERRAFRVILRHAADNYPEAIRPNLDLIGVYGRYDDLYELIGTRLEAEMWQAMKAQFEEDLANLHAGHSISLLAKWIKTPDASSAKTRRLGIMTAQKLGYKVYNFKRILRAMRKRIDIVERYMSAGEWDKISYSEVPSRAMKIYRNAFMRHDEDRFYEFANKAVTGEVKINSSTLYPYDIVHEYGVSYWGKSSHPDNEKILEAQWNQLPNYVEPGQNVLVMADVSGSMCGRPMESSIGLALYFAERNVGAYHNMFMTFSGNPKICTVKGKTLYDKIHNIRSAEWGMNTNIASAFQKVLDIAVSNRIPQNEMVKSIVIISDMEFDSCTRTYGGRDWDFYSEMKLRFAAAGYEIPNIVFWNVNSRHDTFHADKNREGVQLVSGQSTSTFKNLVGCIGYTPMEMMMKVIGSERYAAVTVA